MEAEDLAGPEPVTGCAYQPEWPVEVTFPQQQADQAGDVAGGQSRIALFKEARR